MKKFQSKKLVLLGFLALIIVPLFVLCACGEKESDHAHDYREWTLVKAPTCTQNGSEHAFCTICGNEGTRSVSKLGHDYSGEPVVIKDATCQEEGELSYPCKNGCGESKSEVIPRTKHDFSGEETVKPATCTENGEKKVKCLHCDEVKVTVLSRLGHQYDEEGTVKKPATCEEDGERVFTCERCKETVTEKIDALGHEYGDFIVDRPSSLSEDGQKSRHCLHEGCASQKDITILPAGENVEYSVKAVRSGGRDYPFPNELSVVLYDENGEKAEGPYKLEDGAATFTVKERPLRVKIEGLREGYRQKQEIVLGRNAVDLNLEIEGSVVLGEEKNPEKQLNLGDPMHDFLVRDIHTDPKDYQNFSELLKDKKGAYVFFFYVGCGACSSQFPVFVKEYSAYGEKKNDLLVLMINVYSESTSGQGKTEMLQYSARYPEGILMMSGRKDKIDLFDWVYHPYNAVPFSYFIDGEGVIDEIVYANSSAELKKQYGEALSRYLGERPAETSGAKEVALLPQRGAKRRSA